MGGLVCSGKTTLANLLSQELKWDHVNSGESIRKLVAEAGLQIEDFGSLDVTTLRGVDNKITKEMDASNNCVWEGRLTPWLSRGFSHFLRVFCIASLDVRAQRYARRERIPIPEAVALIRKREAEEAKVFERLYGVTDILALSALDITLDTAFKSPSDLVSEILHVLE